MSSTPLLIYLGLALVLLLLLLALLIPVGRYARRLGLAPRYWIMVNMVCWTGSWVIYKYILVHIVFFKIGIVVTSIMCLTSYIIIWFVIRKKGNSTLNSQIDEIGKKD